MPSSSPGRRRSRSLPPVERSSTAGPQIAVVFDVVSSSRRVGRLLRRRFTEVWHRTRRRHDRPPRPAECEKTASQTAKSAFIRRAKSAASSTDHDTRLEQGVVYDTEARVARPPSAAVSTVTQLIWQRQTTTTSGASAVAGTENAATSAASLRDQFVSFFQVSDNKLAMKLFGNKNALVKEKLRHEATGHWIIHPCSDFRYQPSHRIPGL